MSAKKCACVEKYQGVVVAIEGKVALIKLVDADGRTIPSKYPAKKLAKKGLEEGDRFVAKAVKRGGKIRIKIRKLKQPSFGQQIVGALADFVSDLRSGKPIEVTTVIRDNGAFKFLRDILGPEAETDEPRAKKKVESKEPGTT